MNRLTEEHWAGIAPNDFEQLAADLLATKYPACGFKKTKVSWDGGRDVEGGLPILEGTLGDVPVWAECKMTRKNTAFSDVAPLMLMAYIEDVNKLIVFSYKPVNGNFHRRVADYKRRNGRNTEVEVLDDVALEWLIFECRDIAERAGGTGGAAFDFDRYFPNYAETERTTSDSQGALKYSYRIDVSSIWHSGRDSGKSPAPRPKARLKDIVRVTLYIANGSSAGQEAVFDFEESPDIGCLDSCGREIESGENRLHIGPNTAIALVNEYRIVRYAPAIRPPSSLS